MFAQKTDCFAAGRDNLRILGGARPVRRIAPALPVGDRRRIGAPFLADDGESRVLAQDGADPALQGVRVLMMTARGSVVERRKGLALGADGFIAKPFELAELRGEIARLLAR